MDGKEYLWVNLCDLTEVGTVGPFGSPLNFMILKDRGDCLLPGSYFNPKGKMDESYVVVEATAERCGAIAGGLSVIGPHKIGRKIRTRRTVRLPGKAWEYVGETY